MSDKEEATANVRILPGGWHVIDYGGWQVSVAPDGLLMLPRHLHPREVDEFVGAILAGAEVGAAVVAENAGKTKEVGELPDSKAIVVQGPPPPGAVPMQITPRTSPQPRSAIGRRRRDPREPYGAPPPLPPIPGGRNGRR
jgi:hypothetical protein